MTKNRRCAERSSSVVRDDPRPAAVLTELLAHLLHGARRRLAPAAGGSHRPTPWPRRPGAPAPSGSSGSTAACHRRIAQTDRRRTDEIQPLSPTLDLPVAVRR
jgi:hypothetical protein